MREEGQLPDCDDGCPHIEDQDEDHPQWCEECPYESETYLELQDVDLFYVECQNHMVEHELGLAPPRSELSYKLIEGVKFLHAEQHRQREAQRKDKEEAKRMADELNQRMKR